MTTFSKAIMSAAEGVIEEYESRIDEMTGLLEEIAEYLDGHSDVIDGPYGQPKPNAAMQLLNEVDEVLAKGGKP